MNGIEILAPAGGMEQLIAAVRCGADAVYLGMGGFNARRNAENFSGDGLTEAVSYSHGRGAEVHVTLNPLVYDEEIEPLEREIDRAAAAGVDAGLIQDPAVLALYEQISRNKAPRLHADDPFTTPTARSRCAIWDLTGWCFQGN
jgi:putative protease